MHENEFRDELGLYKPSTLYTVNRALVEAHFAMETGDCQRASELAALANEEFQRVTAAGSVPPSVREKVTAAVEKYTRRQG